MASGDRCHFLQVAHNFQRIPRVFQIKRIPCIFQVFQVCGHLDMPMDGLSTCKALLNTPLCPPIDSIMRLMTVWRITGKIIRTAITLTYAY